MAKQMSKCGLNVPHKDGELTNEQHLVNARAIEDWANFLVASESGCIGGGCTCSSIIVDLSGHSLADATWDVVEGSVDSNIGTAFSYSAGEVAFAGVDGTEVTVHWAVAISDVISGLNNGYLRGRCYRTSDGDTVVISADFANGANTNDELVVSGSRTILLLDGDTLSVQARHEMGASRNTLNDPVGDIGESMSFLCVSVNCGCSGTANTLETPT